MLNFSLNKHRGNIEIKPLLGYISYLEDLQIKMRFTNHNKYKNTIDTAGKLVSLGVSRSTTT